jgi:gag-polyprotein putative aspartyl protease
MKQTFFSKTASSLEDAARELIRVGPVIPVTRSAMASRDRIIAQALIDTGAQANCISKKLAARLGLQVIGDTWIAGVSHNNEIAKEKVDTVIGMVRPGDLQVDIPTELATARFSTGDDQVALLLGRPFLRNFDLSYEGGIGRFSLSWQPPSLVYQSDD